MSTNVAVETEGLEQAWRERGPGAYVITVSADGRPHTVYAVTAWEHGDLVAEVGATTASNAQARSHVSLLLPVRDSSDYSLIVDGTARVETTPATRLRVTPTRAVLHRPGTPAAPTACGSDCVPLATLDRA
jgi:hypothetical protein